MYIGYLCVNMSNDYYSIYLLILLQNTHWSDREDLEGKNGLSFLYAPDLLSMSFKSLLGGLFPHVDVAQLIWMGNHERTRWPGGLCVNVLFMCSEKG